MTWVQRDGYRYMDLGEENDGNDAAPFVIPDLVASTVTLLYGRPKSGKSTLAALAARSIVTGATMLGRIPATNGKAAIIAGDAGDAVQIYSRLIGNVPGIRVCEFARPPTQAAWGALCGELGVQGFSLVVIDNLMAFCPGDINDHLPVRKLSDVLDQFNRAGIAIILVHHTSEHEYSTRPMGNTAISALARWCVRAEIRPGKLVLHMHGNYGAESEIEITRPNGTLAFEVLSEAGTDELAARREKHSKRGLRRADICTYAAENRGKVKDAELARMIARKFGGAISTHQSNLSRGAYGNDADLQLAP